MSRVPDPTETLLARYLAELAEPMGWDPHRPPPPKPVARAGTGTRETFRQAIHRYRDTRAVWQALASAPLDRIWVWSDLHLGHENILRMARRPMPDVESMNTTLLDAASVVPHEDWLVFLGDLMVRRYDDLPTWMSMCPGRKMLILGNHDKGLAVSRWRELGFEAVAPCWALDLEDRTDPLPVSPLQRGPLHRLWWTHYPLDGVRLPPNTLNLHGHIHDRWLDGPRLNVSVERQGYAPRQLSQLLTLERPADASGHRAWVGRDL
jgi:calcineurin-like phosphoesterase family protein